ncbi:MAG: histidine kinase dimerization/phosphoacceptor domain -containing protein [Methanobacteriaceae archaeon]|nr:histidine kinase dimerization/phosphoacceptor domain -containing protein [Methanobacteriaceae archaeon]
MNSPIKILIVDDSKDDTELIVRKLGQDGFDLIYERVETPKSLRNSLINKSWDIVICDYIIPGFGGLKALKISKSINKDLPVIIVSGKIGEEMAVKAMKAGAQDYILKDNLSRLAPAIEREINEFKIRKKQDIALKKSESIYKTIFENTGTATAIINNEMCIEMVNTVFETLSGYKKFEIEGRKKFTDFTAEEDKDIINNFLSSSRNNPECSPRNYETKFRNSKGKNKNVLITLAFIPSTNKILISILDITERKIAEERIYMALKEKEILLKEIHHRVKNNLQIISSLIRLQSRYINDEKISEILNDSQNRIKSMSMVHEKLYQSDNLSKVDLNEYINNLAAELFRSYGKSIRKIKLKVDVCKILMDADATINFGLIINELLSNSLKYAFPDDLEGEIVIKFYKNSEGNYILLIGDNGIGLPSEFNISQSKSLGMRLVNNLCNQLNGDLKIIRENGTLFHIKFENL